MTNLNLPTLTHANLSALLKGRSFKKIGYETHAVAADLSPETIGIWHHGHRIALVSPTGVQLVHAGWNSRTTAHRLNRVCVDNGLSVRVGIRQGVLSTIEGRNVEPLARDRRTTFLTY